MSAWPWTIPLSIPVQEKLESWLSAPTACGDSEALERGVVSLVLESHEEW